MTQENILQPAAASVTEPAATQEEVTQPAQPSPEEVLNQRIQAEVAKAISLETERARREIQSIKDKATAEVVKAQRRAAITEDILGTTKKTIQSLDPDIAKDIELAEFRAKENGRLTQEQEETLRQNQKTFYDTFQNSLVEFVTNLGIDPKDKRIDWGSDDQTPLDIMRKVQTSVATIQKESIKTMQSGLEARLKALETNHSVEVNSVNTGNPSGAGSDAEFLSKFASGEIPMTKDNLAKIKRIQES